MPRLILVRHGQTIFNAQRRYQGQSDIELNEIGLAQAKAVAERLASFRFEAVYSSDLLRARQTAEIILSARPPGPVLQTSPLLREVDGGGFEGLTWDEMTEKYPVEVHAWTEDRTHYAPPGGENLLQVVERLDKILAQIIEEQPSEERSVLVVTHGGAISTLLCRLLGMDLNRLWQWRTDNCSITILDTYPKGAIVSLFNDVNHMEKFGIEYRV